VKSLKPWFRIAGIFIAGSLFYFFCLAYLQPTFHDAQYRKLGTTKVNGVDYVGKYNVSSIESKKMDESTTEINKSYSLLEISMKMQEKAIHPRIYSIKVNNCLIGIDVNAEEQEIVDESCIYPFPHHIKFPHNSQEGENFVVIIAKNNKGNGSVYITASYKDPIVFSLHAIYLLFLCLVVFLILSRVRKKEIRILFSIVFGGTILRYIYFITTPFRVREFDTFSHYNYIQYLYQNWLLIPPANDGWQYSQPPLYYWLASLFSLPAKIFGTEIMAITNLRIFSFVISFCALLTSVWISKMLFKERWKKCVFVSMFAVLPGIVFLSTRVSNDTMFLLIGMLFFAFLLRWWKEGRQKDLYICFIFLGLCLLTKNNGIALIPVVLVTILLKKDISRKLVLKYFVICMVTISLLAGWLYAIRIMQQGEFKVVGNVRMVNPAHRRNITISNFTTYKLTEVLSNPFHNTMNSSKGRKYYWEELIKTVFTSGWNKGERVLSTVRAIHTINFVLLLVVILALTKDMLLSVRKNVPLWALLLFLIMAQIGIVTKERFLGLQKFRYVSLLAIPVTYYFVAGLDMLNPRIRRLLLWLFWIFVILCVLLTFFVIASSEL